MRTLPQISIELLRTWLVFTQSWPNIWHGTITATGEHAWIVFFVLISAGNEDKLVPAEAKKPCF